MAQKLIDITFIIDKRLKRFLYVFQTRKPLYEKCFESFPMK